MLLVDDVSKPQRRNPFSFAFSALLHGGVLAWVIAGAATVPPPAKSLYDREIRPNEDKIVWYNLKQKLPEIAPSQSQPPDSRPARANVKAPQSMVAGERDLADSSPLVFAPPPEVVPPKGMPLPNVVALAPPPRVPPKLFNPPPVAPPTPPAQPELPEPPPVTPAPVHAALPIKTAGPKPRPRAFKPPPAVRATRRPAPAIPEPPQATPTQPVAAALRIAASGPKPTPRAFTPPPKARLQRQAAIQLPEAPVVASVVEPHALPFSGAGPRPRPRDFVPSPAAKRAPKPAALPDAPVVATLTNPKALPIAGAGPKPRPRDFVPAPVVRRAAPGPAALPDAPVVASIANPKALPIAGTGPKPRPRDFVPAPTVKRAAGEPAALPDAPVVDAPSGPRALPLSGAGPKPRPRDFVPSPAAKRVAAGPPALPAAPDVSPNVSAASSALSRLPRNYIRSPNRPTGPAPDIPTDAPAVANAPAQPSLAIVGLNPARTTTVPPPPPPHAAGFSAGPEMHPEGSSAPAASAALNVPGLSVKDSSHDTKPSLLTPFSPTSRENLTAAVHEKSPAFPSAPLDRGAAIVSQSPDPRLSGRVVYSLAIQMPNVTSFSGSWMVWFAEREVLPLGPGAPPPVVHAPVPVRKVDPKYIAAAASERVQGMVRLFGVIRKDGHVDSIALLHHLDVRLDSSAAEALAKWEFTPAQRNGSPVDVDAVFEIPFHLAPLPAAHSKK